MGHVKYQENNYFLEEYWRKKLQDTEDMSLEANDANVLPLPQLC